jgi:hypothetical protein
MKIKLYILTWKDKYALRSLFEFFNFDLTGIDLHINIINNHSDFYIAPEFENQVNIIHNRGTPDFATASLARMWNMALIHGFKDLDNPDADIVVTAQDDTVWNFDWLPQLVKVMKDFDFYADDAGDMVCAYTPKAVKEIGTWDERFHYGFGEGDYFLRAIKHLPDKSSVNDFAHGRVWQPSLHLAKRPEPKADRYEEQSRAHQFRTLSWNVWLYKWGSTDLEGKWPDNIKDRIDVVPNVPHHILYPYFEMKVNNLKEKGYIV